MNGYSFALSEDTMSILARRRCIASITITVDEGKAEGVCIALPGDMALEHHIVVFGAAHDIGAERIA